METELFLPLPTRLFDRELGILRNSKSNKINNFNDVHYRTFQTLETENFLSLRVNTESSRYEPIPIYSMERADDQLIVSDESGVVHIVNQWFQCNLINLITYPCDITSIQVSENSAVYTVKFISGKLFAGDGSGELHVYELNTLDHLRTFSCHDKSIKKVDSLDGQIIVTCSRDNTINVHDLRVKSSNPVNIIQNVHTIQENTGTRGSRSKYAATSSSANSVTDVVFIDNNNLISSGAADGLLKQWDLRVTYKHMKKFHPVTILEYPGNCNKGYSCLKACGSKLFASSVQQEIYQYDLGTMAYETTYTSPTKLSYYTKLDVSHDCNYLATGSEEGKAHIFKIVPNGIDSQKSVNNPIHTLVHADDDDQEYPVCCALFANDDNLMLTTGGDSSIVTKWAPAIYLNKSSPSPKAERNENLSELKTEFIYLRRRTSSSDNIFKLDSNRNSSLRSLRLDSFPNYVIDGMRLPHVVPRIRIKLRNRLTANNWLKTPESESKAKEIAPEETTPKRRSSKRKRRKFCDDNLSPKIIEYFKVCASPSFSIATEN